MKLPFTFGSQLIFRLALPGLLLALVLLPPLQVISEQIAPTIEIGVVFPVFAVLAGLFMVLLDMPIFMVFEGRRYWPSWLKKKFLASEKRRLERLRNARAKAKNEGDNLTATEKAIEIFKFPLNEDSGKPHAVYPTRLGNLMHEFETYPTIKYQMDGVFYWYRIWLGLDKDLRDDLDEQQAVVDSAVYICFIIYFSAILFAVYGLIEWYTFCDLLPVLPMLPWWGVSLGAFAIWITGWFFYRVFVLPPYAQYGNYFKAMFDSAHTNYDPKSVLEIMAERSGDSFIKRKKGADAYWTAFYYLRWNRIKSPISGRYPYFEDYIKERSGEGEKPPEK